MKIWKLVSGIMSILFSCVIIFQSCAAGVVNVIEANGNVSGTVGLLFAILLLTGGIVSIATRNKKAGMPLSQSCLQLQHLWATQYAEVSVICKYGLRGL